MAQPDQDVVVVGAGPVGLSLALGLAREGVSVTVLEKEPDTSEHSRAPIVWPRTQEVFSEVGVLGAFLDAGIVRSRIRLWDVDRDRPLLRVPLEELRDETPCPQLLICPQSTTERILCEALKAEPSATVCFSAEVADLTPVNGRVAVHYERGGARRTVTAAVAAGCDGAHSRVRDVLGTDFDGRTYHMKAALADVRLGPAPDLRSPRMTRARGVATGLRIGEGQWRVIMPRRPDPQDAPPLGGRIEQAVADLFPTRDYTTAWKSEYRLHRRISARFVDGRIVLAGDAAHLTSPVGGQGMNVGVQDAHALTGAIHETLGRGDPAPLSTYEAERRSAVEGGVVRGTDRLTRVLLAGRGAVLVPALRLFGAALELRPIRRFVLRRMAMLEDPSRHRTGA
jgi:2-polyprenyl-6-methoxyphenol hydroxylase-like FAD-dependent oxidoreductase